MRAKFVLAILAVTAAGAIAQAVEPGAIALNQPRPTDVTVNDMQVMFVHMEAIVTDGPGVLGEGEVLHSIWYDSSGMQKQAFRTVVEISVPTELPGLDTLGAVFGADVRASFTADGVAYAECMLPIQLVSSRSTAVFELYLEGRGDGVKPHKGICDIDLQKDGIQVGIPQMSAKDRVVTRIWANDSTAGHTIMGGYCY